MHEIPHIFSAVTQEVSPRVGYVHLRLSCSLSESELFVHSCYSFFWTECGGGRYLNRYRRQHFHLLRQHTSRARPSENHFTNQLFPNSFFGRSSLTLSLSSSSSRLLRFLPSSISLFFPFLNQLINVISNCLIIHVERVRLQPSHAQLDHHLQLLQLKTPPDCSCFVGFAFGSSAQCHPHLKDHLHTSHSTQSKRQHHIRPSTQCIALSPSIPYSNRYVSVTSSHHTLVNFEYIHD